MIVKTWGQKPAALKLMGNHGNGTYVSVLVLGDAMTVEGLAVDEQTV